MIYSCFNEKLGLYEYFKDGRHHPTNGDLPTPQLPAPLGNVGVSAREAGRPLPADAQPDGTGWHARGIVVNCTQRSVQGLQGLGITMTESPQTHPTLIVLVAGFAAYVAFKIYVESMGGSR